MRSTIYYPTLIYIFIAIITILVYWNIYQIPFLYTENILVNKHSIQDLNVFFDRLNVLNWKAFLTKPLVNWTFAMNYALGAKDPAGYHLVNLIIHLINVLLVYMIAQRFFKFPWLCASLFALHPLGTACVSQIFGRTYALGTCFMLIALYTYFSAWQQQRVNIKTYAVLFVLFVCMVLSKQSLVFFPFIILWHILCFTDFSRAFQTSLMANLKWMLMAITVISIVLFFSVFYAAPLSANAAVDSKTFMLSQLGNIPEILTLYFLPFHTALRHDLPFYSHMTSTNVLLGIFYLLMYIAVMLRFRRSSIGFLMGAFLLALLPTNSIFPKDEVVLEWRLYPSLIFFVLLIGNLVYLAYHAYAIHMKKFLRVGAVVGIACYLLYLSSFGLSIWLQNIMYRSNIAAWEQVWAQYPYSANAVNNLGVIYFSQYDYTNAEYYFKKATEMNPNSSVYQLNLAKTYREKGETELSESTHQEALRLRKLHGSQVMTIYMKD